MKWLVSKGLVQVAVSSILVILAGMFCIGGGSMGHILWGLIIKLSLASSAGILVADFDLYTGKKTISLSMVIVTTISCGILCFIGLCVCFFLIDNNVESKILLIMVLFFYEVLAVVGYNYKYYYHRDK